VKFFGWESLSVAAFLLKLALICTHKSQARGIDAQVVHVFRPVLRSSKLDLTRSSSQTDDIRVKTGFEKAWETEDGWLCWANTGLHRRIEFEVSSRLYVRMLGEMKAQTARASLRQIGECELQVAGGR
jgi:hypothetical protein